MFCTINNRDILDVVSKRKKTQELADESTLVHSDQTIPEGRDTTVSDRTERGIVPSSIATEMEEPNLSRPSCVNYCHDNASGETTLHNRCTMPPQSTHIAQSLSEECWTTPKTSPSHSFTSIVEDGTVIASSVVCRGSDNSLMAKDTSIHTKAPIAICKGTSSISETSESPDSQCTVQSDCRGSIYSTEDEVHITMEPDYDTKIILERDDDDDYYSC